MGWGILTIIKKEKEIIIEIKNPPYGIQKESDNCDFIINVILGYLWVIDKKFRIIEIKCFFKKLIIKYGL